MKKLWLVLVLCLWIPSGRSQETLTAPQGRSEVSFPHVIRFSGAMPENLNVNSPASVTFRIFTTASGGLAIWQETQAILPNSGKVSALIGSTTATGIPDNLFSQNVARFLEVQYENEAPLGRTELAAVPYAMKAASADLFAGRPLSAFVLRSPEMTAFDTTGTNPVYATLGANNFVGTQTIQGNLSVSGYMNGSSSTISSAALVNQLLWVKATAASGGVIAIKGENMSTGGTAVMGQSSATSGTTFGVYGRSASPTGTGVFGLTSSLSGSPEAVVGQTSGTTGHGVAGYAINPIGLSVGVYGKAVSSRGTGIMGESTPAANGYPTYGVVGRAHGNYGTAVQGIADSTTGATVGVQGSVASATGTGGLFANAMKGNILIGQSAATRVFRVDGTGKVYANGGLQSSGADFAESIAVRGAVSDYQPGDVLVIDDEADRRVRLSYRPYSTRVIGIYSTKPGTLSSTHAMDAPEFQQEIPVAVIGLVPCKVTAINGAIRRGDLLVSSSVPGRAMKATDRGLMHGAVVGKATQELAEGDGIIEVLVTLE